MTVGSDAQAIVDGLLNLQKAIVWVGMGLMACGIWVVSGLKDIHNAIEKGESK